MPIHAPKYGHKCHRCQSLRMKQVMGLVCDRTAIKPKIEASRRCRDCCPPPRALEPSAREAERQDGSKFRSAGHPLPTTRIARIVFYVAVGGYRPMPDTRSEKCRGRPMWDDAKQWRLDDLRQRAEHEPLPIDDQRAFEELIHELEQVEWAVVRPALSRLRRDQEQLATDLGRLQAGNSGVAALADRYADLLARQSATLERDIQDVLN